MLRIGVIQVIKVALREGRLKGDEEGRVKWEGVQLKKGAELWEDINFFKWF
jgi:hypothetical protein